MNKYIHTKPYLVGQNRKQTKLNFPGPVGCFCQFEEAAIPVIVAENGGRPIDARELHTRRRKR